jgi:hypothetical protein
MTFSLESALPVLERTPAVLRALLGHLPPEWLSIKERAGGWSPREILGHLIHGEKTDWVPRARIILEQGISRPFEPFDMLGHEREIAGRPVDELLAEFEALRADNVQALVSLGLTEADLGREGMHPAFGRVTLRQHLATWVVHDLDHLCQVARVMAKQYKPEVGPWAAYLGVLHDREA